MDTQLKDTLQRRLHILRDELAFLPGGMQLEAKQLLRETLEENLAIARVDGNQKEIEQFAAALLLIVVLVKKPRERRSVLRNALFLCI